MRRSTDLIQNNSQIYRVYARRLANPADQDIFIASARKLTNFLSDSRAYYDEAQEPIIEILEVACNSLKNIASSVFSKPGSMDRSVIPDDKAPLFDAFEKLVNSVSPHVDLFTGQPLKNRLRSFLSSIGISLPGTTIDLTSDSPTETSATLSKGDQVDSSASQVQGKVSSSSPKETPPSDSMPTTSSPASTVKAPASDQPVSSVPASAADQVPSVGPVEAKGSDNGAVIRSTPSQQIEQSPASRSLGQSSSPQATSPGNVNNPVPAEHDQVNRPPAPSVTTLGVSSSLHTQTSTSSPVSVPRVALVSSQKDMTMSSVTPLSASPKIMSKDLIPQPMSPSLTSAGQVGVAQASQVTPSQDQAPLKTPASPALVSQSSAQQKSKPRQPSGLDFLQLDLQVAREKKLKAALAAEQQKSAEPVLSTSTATAPVHSMVTSPTSTAIAGSPNTPVGPISMSKVVVVAQATPAGTPPVTGSTPVPLPATISDDSNTTQKSQIAQPSSSTLIHRDLRQKLTRGSTSGTTPLRLRITDRAPAPAPEPGSSSAPIVIDEDDESTPTPAHEFMEVDVPAEALPALGKTMVAMDQEVNMGNDREPQHDQVTSSPVVERPTTGNLRTDVIVTQNPSVPSISSTRPSFVTQVPAIPASGPEPPLASSNGETTGAQPLLAKDDNEQEKVAKGSVEPLGVSTTEIVSGTTTAEPLLGGESSAIKIDSTHTIEDVEMAPPPPTTVTETAVAESSAAPLVSCDTAEPSLQSNMAKSHGVREHEATVSVVEASLATGKHQRSFTPSDGDSMRVIPRTAPVSESQQEPPTVVLQSDIVRPISADLTSLEAEWREKEGGSGRVVDPSLKLGKVVSQTPSTSSSKASQSMLAPPSTKWYARVDSFSDMDISSSSLTPPPIVVLGTRTRGSTASSDSPSASPRSGKRPSEAGTEPVKTEEFEDEMVDELAPLFGKEMRVLCMERAWDVPGEFTWNFTLPQIDWDRVSQWATAPENVDSDLSRVRCITLACYVMKDLEHYATQGGLTREQWFENVKPVPWANLPPHLWAMFNDKFYAVFPPDVSPDDLFDVSPFLQLGDNKITFTQIDGMEDYVLVLHGHHPTPAQLVPIHARWDQERSFIKKLQWFARPFTIDN